MTDASDKPRPLDYRNPKDAVDPTNRVRTVLVRVFGTIVVLLFVVTIFMPGGSIAREPALRIKCAQNLRALGTVVQLYASENRGQLPSDWRALLHQEDLLPEILTCPSSDESRAEGATTQAMNASLLAGGHISYAWVGTGLTFSKLTPTTVIAFDLHDHAPRDRAKNAGINVLLGDGATQFVDAPTAEAIRAQFYAGIRPIVLPTPAAVTPTTTGER